MRRTRVIVLAVAVVAAILAALLARRWVAVQESRVEPAANAVAMAEVVVAARDIPMGSVLQNGDLRFDRWPAASAAKFVVRRDGDDPRTQFVGQTAKRDMVEGEPVTVLALRKNSSGMMAGLLTPGNRAVSIPVTNTTAAAGFVTPGDRVDVLLAADVMRTAGNEAERKGAMVRYAAETVLTDVRVLAIDQNTNRAKEGGAQEGKTATLEVTPKQAEILAAASMLGSLSLVLRSADNAAVSPPATPFTPDTEASRALESVYNARPKAAPAGGHGGGGGQVMVNRAGQVRAESFGR